METGLVADISLVHAWMGDSEGNLVYRKTARNFNPVMATAGKLTVAEVEHLVSPGDIDADHIVTPGIFVHRIVHVPNAEKRIEQRTTRKRNSGLNSRRNAMRWTREEMAARAAKELKDGFYVNLGIGIPTLVSTYVPEGVHVQLQSKSGRSRRGAVPYKERRVTDLVARAPGHRDAIADENSSCRAPTFVMIRGGHIDLAILGAMQVSETGDLANWMIPGKMVKGMGGAMNIVAASSASSS